LTAFREKHRPHRFRLILASLFPWQGHRHSPPAGPGHSRLKSGPTAFEIFV
jgi:hypothetical protein